MKHQLEWTICTVQNLFNRHDDTYVNIASETIRQGAHIDGTHQTLPHTETRTFINQGREFSTIFEMDGATYKFTDSDHIILTAGDNIKIAWYARRDEARIVVAIANVSRGIIRRATTEVWPIIVTVFGVMIISCLISIM